MCGWGGRVDPGLASDAGERSPGLEAVDVKHGPVGDRGDLERGEPVGERFVVDVEDGAVVAAFAADADFGFAAALAGGNVDGADAERLDDLESAQQQQHDERSFLAMRPALGGA
jgi:hypothetical protein